MQSITKTKSNEFTRVVKQKSALRFMRLLRSGALSTFFTKGSKNSLGYKKTIPLTAAGFTLIELLLYVSLSGIILFAASGLLMTISEVRQKDQVVQSVEEEGMLIAYSIDSAIKNSIQVITPTAHNSENNLIIEPASLNRDSPMVSFFEKNGVLYSTRGGGAPIAISSGAVIASDVKFENITSDKEYPFIHFSFKLSSSDASGRIVYSKTFIGGGTPR